MIQEKEQKMVIITDSDRNLNEGFKPLYFFNKYNEPCVIYYITFPYSEFHGASPVDGWLDICIGEKSYTVDGGCLEKYEDFISSFNPDFQNQGSIKESFEKHVKIFSKIRPISEYLRNAIMDFKRRTYLKDDLIKALKNIFNQTINKLLELNDDIPYYDEKRLYHQKYENSIKDLTPTFNISRINGKINVIMNDDAKVVLRLTHTNCDIINDYVSCKL